MYDLSFGNANAVRQAFLDIYNGDLVVFSSFSLMKFDYPPKVGDPELIELTKQVIKRQTGQEYKHVIMTNGATGGVVIALRAFAHFGKDVCITRKSPWFARYPGMIRAAGLGHVDETFYTDPGKAVILLDYPSNPLALTTDICPVLKSIGAKTILDGVYFNNVYTRGTINNVPHHDVMVGSYSKLLGLGGLRCGWIATNSDYLAAKIENLVTHEYCGLSKADSDIAKSVLRGLNWNHFEEQARFYLDCNREEFSKLEKFFGDTKVPDMGMFWYAPMDESCQKLLEKSGVIWTKGSEMGTDDSFGRLNMGADMMLTRRAATVILKNDKV